MRTTTERGLLAQSGRSACRAFKFMIGEAFLADIFGTPGNDSGANALTGTNDDDMIFGFAGDDEIFGLDGNDTIDGGLDDDFIDGGDGNDIITDNDGNNEILGGNGDDIIDVSGGVGDNFIVPGEGNDTIIGNSDANNTSAFTFLSYFGVSFGLTVDLVAGTAIGPGKNDTFSDVFSIRGTCLVLTWTWNLALCLASLYRHAGSMRIPSIPPEVRPPRLRGADAQTGRRAGRSLLEASP